MKALKMCLSKTKMRQGHAEALARNLNKVHKWGKFRAYFCPVCQHFHLTSKRKLAVPRNQMERLWKGDAWK